MHRYNKHWDECVSILKITDVQEKVLKYLGKKSKHVNP